MNKEPFGLRISRLKAKRLLARPKRLADLVQRSMEKISQHRGALSKVLDELRLMIRWVKAWLGGQYPKPSVQIALMAIGGLIYLVNPFDLIPDFIFQLGLIDDVSILLYVISQVREELLAFEQWEKEQGIENINSEIDNE